MDVLGRSAICLVFASTLPVLGEKYRLVAARWFIDSFTREMRGCGLRLDSAVHELKSRWVDVLNEANSRLGVKFRLTDYPDPSLLHGLWKVEIEVDSGNQKSMSTLSILKGYSTFFRPPQ